MSKQGESCGNCRFWRKDEGEDDDCTQGECRRFPPTVQVIDGVSYPNSEWPNCDNVDWCGEWQRLKASDPTDVGLDHPVSVLDLSVRISHCFASRGIETLRDLVSTTENELMRCRGFAKTCLHYTKEALKARGLWLGMLPPKEKP